LPNEKVAKWQNFAQSGHTGHKDLINKPCFETDYWGDWNCPIKK